MALLETTKLQPIDYGKSLPSHDREEYAKALAEFNNAFQNRRNRHEAIPTTLVDPIRPKEVRFIQRKRQRGLPDHEAAQAQEAHKRRRRQTESIELARSRKHDAIIEKDCGVEESLCDRNTRLLQIADGDLPIDNLDDNEELLYLRIQPRAIRNENVEDHRQTPNFFDYVSRIHYESDKF